MVSYKDQKTKNKYKMLTAYAQTTAEDVASGTAAELARLLETVITRIPLFIAAIIVIVLTVIVAKVARRVVENKLAEKGIDQEHQELQILGGRMTSTVIIVLGVTMALKIAGIDFTTIIAAAAFGIGFALRDLIMNFLGGVMILASRHFTIGDYISVGNTVGRVMEIQSRVTVLQANDGTKVIVPNSVIFRKQVTSLTSNPFRRIELDVTVDYRHNIENVLKVCMNAAKQTKGVLIEPKPAVIVDEFIDKGVTLKVRVWVESRGGWVRIKSALAQNLKKTLDQYGIRMSWPVNVNVEDKDMPIAEKAVEPAAPAPTTAPAPVAQEVPVSDEPLKPLSEQ